jgi:2-aminomuconate deaminase
MGPRTPGSDEVPGGPVWNERGEKQEYDIEAQTRAVIDNVRTVLEASGSSLEEVVDIQCFLIDMERDFETFNRVYAEAFGKIEATRTTVQIDRLPTSIAVEFKVVAGTGQKSRP